MSTDGRPSGRSELIDGHQVSYHKVEPGLGEHTRYEVHLEGHGLIGHVALWLRYWNREPRSGVRYGRTFKSRNWRSVRNGEELGCCNIQRRDATRRLLGSVFTYWVVRRYRRTRSQQETFLGSSVHRPECRLVPYSPEDPEARERYQGPSSVDRTSLQAVQRGLRYGQPPPQVCQTCQPVIPEAS